MSNLTNFAAEGSTPMELDLLQKPELLTAWNNHVVQVSPLSTVVSELKLKLRPKIGTQVTLFYPSRISQLCNNQGYMYVHTPTFDIHRIHDTLIDVCEDTGHIANILPLGSRSLSLDQKNLQVKGPLDSIIQLVNSLGENSNTLSKAIESSSLICRTEAKANINDTTRLVDILFRQNMTLPVGYLPVAAPEELMIYLDSSSEEELYYDLDNCRCVPGTRQKRYTSRLLRVTTHSEFAYNMYLSNLPIKIGPKHDLLKCVERAGVAPKKYINIDAATLASAKKVGEAEYSDAETKIIASTPEALAFGKGIVAYWRRKLFPVGTETPQVSSESVQPIVTGTPLGPRKSIPKAVRDRLWRETVGSLDGKCYCCSSVITFNNWEAGHVQARAKGGSDDITNLRPICGACNKSMGTMNMEEFITTYGLRKLL